MKKTIFLLLLLSCAGILRAQSSFMAEDDNDDEEVETLVPSSFISEHDRIIRRQEWFMQQRMLPADTLPMHHIIQVAAEAAAKRGIHPKESSLQTFIWEPLGPDTIAGRMTCVAVHPQNSNIWLAGAAAGGVWKTTNRGATWEQLPTESFPVYAIHSLLINPQSPNEIFAGTGEANFATHNYPGAGIMYSSDGGAHWSRRGAATLSGTITELTLHPARPTLMFASCAGYGSPAGIYRSTDKGQTWTRVLEGATAMQVVIHPTSPNLVYGILAHPFGNDNNGIYRSTDTGKTWTKLQDGLPQNPGRMAFAISRTVPARLYALVANVTGGFNGLYVSTDDGNTFSMMQNVPTNLFGNQNSGQGWYDIDIATSPTDANDMAIGGVKLYRTTSGGNSWTEITGIHVDQHAVMYINSDSLLAGNDGGVFAVRNFQGYGKNRNLVTTQYYDITTYSSSLMLGGTQDNGGHLWNNAWGIVLGGDVMHTLIPPANPTVYFACGPFGFVYKSTNGGQNWSGSINGITTSDKSAWVAPLIPSLASGGSNTIFTATTKVYKSTDLGENWQAISPHLVNATTPVTAIAQSPQDGAYILAATQDGNVFYTSTGGAAWGTIGNTLPNKYPTSCAIQPNDKRSFVVTYSGYFDPHIWRSVNQGFSWTDVSGDLPDVPVNCFVFDSDNPATTWYIGTDLGMYFTVDGGMHWQPGFSNIGMAPVIDIELLMPSHDLYIATYGMGVYRTKTTSLPVEMSSFTGKWQGSNIALDWQTASELNNDHFVVERSTSDNAFQPLDIIPGHGTSNIPRYYSYADHAVPPDEQIWYRLRQVDRDGTSTYSPIVALSRDNVLIPEGPEKNPAEVQSAPNPFNDEALISYQIPKTSKVSIVLYNMLGQTVRVFYRSVHHNSGKFVLTWNGRDDAGRALPSGTYFLHLTVNDVLKTIPVIKQ